MKASKFTDAQKAFILKQGEEGTSVAEICRKAGIGQSTYFAWKKKYGGLLPDEMRRLKQLEGKRRLRPIDFALARCRDGAERRASGSSSGTTRRGPYEPIACWA